MRPRALRRSPVTMAGGGAGWGADLDLGEDLGADLRADLGLDLGRALVGAPVLSGWVPPHSSQR